MNADTTTATNTAAQFQIDTAHHQMTILHDYDVYRHIRFRRPDSGVHGFDLVTWPGHLSITGDVHGHTFARADDMFTFFRAASGWTPGTINPQYWAEKIVTGREGVKDYDEDRFVRLVKEHVANAVQSGNAPRGLGKAVREEILDDPEICHEAGARAALDAFGYKGFRFADVQEWDLRDWSHHYLWVCHAIQWGISKYDAFRQAPQTLNRHGGAR